MLTQSVLHFICDSLCWGGGLTKCLNIISPSTLSQLERFLSQAFPVTCFLAQTSSRSLTILLQLSCPLSSCVLVWAKGSSSMCWAWPLLEVETFCPVYVLLVSSTFTCIREQNSLITEEGIQWLSWYFSELSDHRFLRFLLDFEVCAQKGSKFLMLNFNFFSSDMEIELRIFALSCISLPFYFLF